MSFKCLNCHMVCAPDDKNCPFCHYQITNTSSALKKSAAAGSAKFAILFTVIGSAIYNSVLAPKWYPSNGGGINNDRLLMAAVVGACCAVVGMIFGSLISDRD